MSFISYAQNFEDIMLNRAFGNVDNGFYIDVGAWHPTIDSVTKSFYDRGWYGINIEPSQQYFLLLQRDRPRDINLNVAVGATECEMIFHEVLDTGLSSFKEEFANLHAETGYKINNRMVQVKTLASICTKYHVETIHFLKVDVEGGEREALQGFPFTSLTPWIVIVEAIDPITHCDVSGDWEGLLFENGYSRAFYDGLNKFYISEGHLEMMASFKVPPNCLDDYVTYREISRAEDGQQELEDMKRLHEALMQELADEKNKRTAIERRLDNILSSRSWRLTGPLRKLYELLSRTGVPNNYGTDKR